MTLVTMTPPLPAACCAGVYSQQLEDGQDQGELNHRLGALS